MKFAVVSFAPSLYEYNFTNQFFFFLCCMAYKTVRRFIRADDAYRFAVKIFTKFGVSVHVSYLFVVSQHRAGMGVD